METYRRENCLARFRAFCEAEGISPAEAAGLGRYWEFRARQKRRGAIREAPQSIEDRFSAFLAENGISPKTAQIMSQTLHLQELTEKIRQASGSIHPGKESASGPASSQINP